MGLLYESLCKGPVVVIDDGIEEKGDPIRKLIEDIKSNHIPVLSAKSPNDFKIENLLYSNFIILDWQLAGETKPGVGVTVGEEAGTAAIAYIKKLKEISLGPIFIVTNLSVDDIETSLKENNIPTKGIRYVFIESKSKLKDWNSFVNQIESWIKESPHIYLAKWWTNEWLKNNNLILWGLYELNHNWPTLFYHAFGEQGEDPILGLRDALIQLTSSEIDMSTIDHKFLSTKIPEADLKSLDNLYMRLVYTTKNIQNDIRPGDIFKLTDNGKELYFLNIRPECDTTRPKDPDDDITLYLLEGKTKKPKDFQKRYDDQRGQIIPWQDEIPLLYLDNHKIVRFDKNALHTVKLKEISTKGYKKICRVMPPFVTQIRQSYSNYIARFGLPSYPRQIVDSLFTAIEKKDVN
jgi:hypothetical protein